MREVRLNIHINKPVKEVWDYALDSNNISNWFTSIKEEIPDSVPAKLGTKLRNRGEDLNSWGTYEVTEFEKYKIFTLSSLDNDYHVKYTFDETNGECDLEYYEWCDNSEISDPATMEPLELLKNILEQ